MSQPALGSFCHTGKGSGKKLPRIMKDSLGKAGWVENCFSWWAAGQGEARSRYAKANDNSKQKPPRKWVGI